MKRPSGVVALSSFNLREKVEVVPNCQSWSNKNKRETRPPQRSAGLWAKLTCRDQASTGTTANVEAGYCTVLEG